MYGETEAVICWLELVGRLKCLGTGLDASLSFPSMSRCSRNRSPDRDIWKGIGQRTHCFASCHLMRIFHQHNGLPPMLFDLSVANKKKLIDISEPAM